jgi:heme/copper-type cytochrome/quinol oxidase subunit 4
MAAERDCANGFWVPVVATVIAFQSCIASALAAAAGTIVARAIKRAMVPMLVFVRMMGSSMLRLHTAVRSALFGAV